MADPLEKKCDHCGKVITGKGERFCGQKCSRAWGRKVSELRRKYPEARFPDCAAEDYFERQDRND